MRATITTKMKQDKHQKTMTTTKPDKIDLSGSKRGRTRGNKDVNQKDNDRKQLKERHMTCKAKGKKMISHNVFK